MESVQFLMKSSIAKLYLIVSEKALEGIFLSPQKVPLIRNIDPSSAHGKILNRTIRQLEEYFAGRRKVFDLPLSFSGTSFQEQVWKQLSQIPFGATVSYRDIAKRIKNPKAVRAVGTANSRNPLCIVIPCHRVITAQGTIGGYTGGVAMKRRLLALEGKIIP